MNRINKYSDEFLRGMALHYLKEHKRDLIFRARLDAPTIDALKVRGCVVDPPDSDGVHTVRSGIPFGKLVTAAEWRKSRLELLQAIGLFVFMKGGGITVPVAAMYFRMGMVTAVLWFWGWLFLSNTLFPETPRKDRPVGIAVALAFFLSGWAVHAIGWSDN